MGTNRDLDIYLKIPVEAFNITDLDGFTGSHEAESGYIQVASFIQSFVVKLRPIVAKNSHKLSVMIY